MTTLHEVWRDIPGHEGRYEVSSEGRIRSYVAWRGRSIPHLLTPHDKGKKPHLMVNLRRDGERVPTLVHRAVLAAFSGPPPEGAISRHLDGDATNNALRNLVYGTPSENELDKLRHGTHQMASRTHCKHGHEFTPENTARTERQRRCRACSRARERARESTPESRAKRATYMRAYNRRVRVPA